MIRDTVIDDVWENIISRLGEEYVQRIIVTVEIAECLNKVSRPKKYICAPSLPIFSDEKSFRAIFTLLILHLEEAYKHTLLGSMRSMSQAKEPNVFDSTVNIETSEKSLRITNPFYVEKNVDINSIMRKFSEGNQKRELDKILSLVEYSLHLTAEYPKENDIKSGKWPVEYKWGN